MEANRTIIAVVPAYNEEKSIGSVISKTKEYVDKVIVIDDGSIDGTYGYAKEAGAIAVRHIINRGAGAATWTGIQAALKLNADIIVTIDADGQHLPGDIPDLIKPILESRADVVIGSRLKGNIDRMPFTKKIGNILLNKITYLFYGINITDTQSGFKAFSRGAASLINISVDRYGFCSEVIGELRKKKLRFVEVSIPTIYLDKNKGTTTYDGFKILFDLVLRGMNK